MLAQRDIYLPDLSVAFLVERWSCVVSILLDHMEAHVLDSELTCHGVKVWLAQGAEMGSGAVFWTQSFWLQILGVKNAVEYRKQQKRRGYLPSIADDWQLDGLTFEEHPGGLTGGQLCIRTNMVRPWHLKFQCPPRRAEAVVV